MAPQNALGAARAAEARQADDQLMAEVASGSQTALAALMARHRERVVRLGVRAVGDRGHAEDIAQETFLRVYRHAPDYEPRGQFSSWLLTIASRLCLNASRRARRQPEIPLGAAAEQPAASSPENALELRELGDALLGLPPRQRMALLLKTVEGRSYREIAQALECSESDVANAIFRARRTLAKELRG